MRIKTIETRWNECKKYLHIIHFALSLSSEPLSEGEFKYVEKNLITVFFNPKITMKYSTSQANFLHLPTYDYADDHECYLREEWDAILIIRINIYGWDL